MNCIYSIDPLLNLVSYKNNRLFIHPNFEKKVECPIYQKYFRILYYKFNIHHMFWIICCIDIHSYTASSIVRTVSGTGAFHFQLGNIQYVLYLFNWPTHFFHSQAVT